MGHDFDFVIAGGGAAGSVLANRLSADPRNRVCLIEAGGKGTSAIVNTPFGLLAQVPGWINNWNFETVPQTHLNNRKLFQPRGRTLGGSTAINAMICIRGVPNDYDTWAQMGATGWSYDDLRPYFIKSETHEGGASEVHGNTGPQPVNRLQDMRPVSQVFLKAAQELQMPFREDFNEAKDTFGVGAYHVFQKNGERFSAARSYLPTEVRRRENLTILTKAPVLKVMMEGTRATGVEIRHAGKKQRVHAGREMILSSGAFGSPHILQLSGIGDFRDLQRAGIAVHHDLPGVGKNLSDHLDIIAYSPDKSGRGVSVNPWFAARHVLPGLVSYIRGRTGMMTSNFSEVGGFAKSGLNGDLSDLQFHLVCAGVYDHGRKLPLRSLTSLHICNLYPHSRGTVKAKSADPTQPPAIDPAYLSDTRDLEVMKEGLRQGLRLMNAPAFRVQVGHVREPADGEDVEAYIRKKSDTIYHPVGTCKMGQDAMAVVDPQLRVHGLQNLRVVDASIMPRINGGNTTAPTLAIAEKAADLILGA